MEAFALATDRAKFLETLIPGTEDYYHYHALHALHAGRHDEVRELLERWYEKHRSTSRYQEAKRRLLLSREDPDAFEELRQELGLLFQHQRQVDGQQTDYPTELEPGRVDRDAFERAASSSSHLNHYGDPALEWLPERQLSVRQRRELLDRLTLPDHPALLGLIVADMQEDDKTNPQFGGRSIHARLTRAQLEALLYQLPNLRKQDAFVQAYLARLRPPTRVDLEVDLDQRRAFLERVWAFVETLEPAFHSLKLHVLYHWLDMERRQGVYDRERFLRYLQLPRNADYVEPTYLKRDEFRYQPVGSLGMHFASLGLAPSPSDDEPLVRDFLTHFFAEAADWKPWDVYVRDVYLKRLFATTKVLLGQGDGERWHTLLNDPSYYQQLKDRVDLEFALDNPTWFGAGDAVALDVYVKHVDRLTAKVFRINALNYALAQGTDVDAAIDLDGMIASEETVHTYDEPPLRRVRRTFTFPGLTGPGTYVIELLGGGRSSRALVRKGKLRFVERMGAAGHVFTILDEANQLVPGASLWLAGREYRADEEGELHVPYSTDPGPRQVVLQHGDLVTVDAFQHRAEQYAFEAGLFVEREALLARQEAQVVIRPRLLLRDQPVSLSLIEEPTLTIEATDLHGVSSSRELTLELHDDRETTQTFRVSPELAALTLRVRARVKRASTGAYQDLVAERRVELNGIDAGDAVQHLHLAHTEAGHVVYLLGKSGEPRAHVPINVGLHHRDFRISVHMTLQTDAAGRVGLGALPGIVRLEVATGDGASRDQWELNRRPGLARPGSAPH